MAYETGNPPHLAGDQPVAAPRTWKYYSTHLQAVVGTSDHISNGQDIGMAAGDTVIATESTLGTYTTSYHAVTVVAATYTSLTTGLMVSSAS
jgi:hypothetical protein|tara:strand:+ start:302 stop:577 length:276 start_codon:yes stop_codon:yes gene_type:complete